VTIPNLKNETAFSYNLSNVKNSTNRFYIDYAYNDDLIDMSLSVKFYAVKPEIIDVFNQTLSNDGEAFSIPLENYLHYSDSDLIKA
jgi:hypothetical protein